MSLTENVRESSVFEQGLALLESVCPECVEKIRESEAGLMSMFSGLGLDADAQVTGILHAGLSGVRERRPLSNAQERLLEENLGRKAYELYRKVRRIHQLPAMLISSTDGKAGHQSSDENIRRMLISMVDDARVVVIGLAIQVHRLRSLHHHGESFRKIQARLTQRIYAPLANRLGLWDLKWEMEDLAFRYLNPETYQFLASQLNEKRKVREDYIRSFIDQLSSLLHKANIDAEIHGRPKHIFSIWKKMQGKHLEFEEIWDMQAVRILVDDVEACYASLNVVNTNWQHYPSEFVDYIATPKPNGYQSIHVVVAAPENKTMEVQIRTHAMHRESELGYAAHWRYKENAEQDSNIDSKVVWLRQLLEWKDEVLASTEDEKTEDGYLEHDARVFVFTPKGSVIDLPKGSTPIDFAYAIHTEVGHRTRGAYVNGKMVSLNTKLVTGDQVQIQMVKQGGPSRDWIRDENGYVCSSRARSRIQHWFKHNDFEHYLSQGRNMLDRELRRLGMEDLSYEKINQHTHYQTTNDLLAAIGSHDYKLSRALSPFRENQSDGADAMVPSTRPSKTGQRKSELTVLGVGNLLTSIASCCQPVPGDRIVGYITAGRGITIHRKNCINVRNLDKRLLDRLIDVSWNSDGYSSYVLSLRATAFHRAGLLNDISEVIKSSKIEVLKVNMETDDEQITRIVLQLGVPDSLRPNQVLNRLNKVRNVFSVRRMHS
ncbi:MAG: bifunctional (p)ppGpp synthetase/guanosine-3',5'-bis(diphosphate) 3'-pyrophosphohydrolase [Gammaproteobacteria bacterium]|nr:bifunctional (p)ppGpp synthetase/guanosine-3',5'-bis(diphosphate) 3'-pyrophosphohydrolase [Gammaproteobacteria bacterium]